jgi:hypothetical protein
MSSSVSSSGSSDDTEYRQSPPAKGCTRIRAKGGVPMPNGIGSADPKGSMCTTILVYVIGWLVMLIWANIV